MLIGLLLAGHSHCPRSPWALLIGYLSTTTAVETGGVRVTRHLLCLERQQRL